MDKYKFGRRLQTARKEQGLSADAIAELCGINAIFYRQIESGIKLPSLKNLTIICSKLNASPDYLLSDSIKNEITGKQTEITEKLKHLSPNQLELAEALIDTLLKQSGEVL